MGGGGPKLDSAILLRSTPRVGRVACESRDLPRLLSTPSVRKASYSTTHFHPSLLARRHHYFFYNLIQLKPTHSPALVIGLRPPESPLCSLNSRTSLTPLSLDIQVPIRSSGPTSLETSRDVYGHEARASTATVRHPRRRNHFLPRDFGSTSASLGWSQWVLGTVRLSISCLSLALHCAEWNRSYCYMFSVP